MQHLPGAQHTPPLPSLLRLLLLRLLLLHPPTPPVHLLAEVGHGGVGAGGHNGEQRLVHRQAHSQRLDVGAAPRKHARHAVDQAGLVCTQAVACSDKSARMTLCAKPRRPRQHAMAAMLRSSATLQAPNNCA